MNDPETVAPQQEHTQFEVQLFVQLGHDFAALKEPWRYTSNPGTTRSHLITRDELLQAIGDNRLTGLRVDVTHLETRFIGPGTHPHGIVDEDQPETPDTADQHDYDHELFGGPRMSYYAPDEE